jgi:integrase/recombinase XerD
MQSSQKMVEGAGVIAEHNGPCLLPALIGLAGERAGKRFVEFFTARIRNANTRRAYARAITGFFAWCEVRGLELHQVEPVAVAAYIEQHPGAKPTVKLHLAAIRMLFDWLVTGQVVPFNPASSVRGPKYVVTKGLTPVLTAAEARHLLDSIDTGTIIGLRDRALIGVMAFSFARIGATLGMRVKDYHVQTGQKWVRLHEKGGRLHAVPAHPTASKYLEEYLGTAGISDDMEGAIFRTLGKDKRLTGRPMAAIDALKMIKRRARAAALPGTIGCHTFRATGITAYLEAGGTIEGAQAIAGHESPRTTMLYDRRGDMVTMEEIGRIAI